MPEDFTWLADALNDADEVNRQQAAQMARTYVREYPAAIAALVELLPRATEKAVVLDVLSSVISDHDEVSNAAVLLLVDEDERVQRAAANALRYASHRDIVRVALLKRAVNKTLPSDIRQGAIGSLSPVSDHPEVASTLTSIGRDDADLHVRRAAQSAMGNPSAVAHRAGPAARLRLMLIGDDSARGRATDALADLRRILGRLEDDPALPEELVGLVRDGVRRCDELGGLLPVEFDSPGQLRRAVRRGRNLYERISSHGWAVAQGLLMFLNVVNGAYMAEHNLTGLDSERLATIRVEVEQHCAAFDVELQPFLGVDADPPRALNEE